jgi:hypothetical protein
MRVTPDFTALLKEPLFYDFMLNILETSQDVRGTQPPISKHQ